MNFLAWSHPRLPSTATRRPDRRLQDLLSQQLWCWGRDVSAAPTNLLIGHGLARHPSPKPGSHRYCHQLPDGFEIHLWAFGVCVRSPLGGIFLHRYQRRPRPLPPRWDPTAIRRADQLRIEPMPATSVHARLLDRFLRWTCDYEQWATRTMGPAYRQQTLTAWEHPVARGNATAAAWADLLADYQRCRSAATRSTTLFSRSSPWRAFKTG